MKRVYTLQQYDPANAEHQANVKQHDLQDLAELVGPTLHLQYIDGKYTGNYTYQDADGSWFIHEGSSSTVPESAPTLEAANDALQQLVEESP